MVTSDVNEIPSNASPLYHWRGKAIEAYASMELSLSILFSDLLQSPIQYAGIVFFRITNTSSRNTIIETLLSKRYGDTYTAFWSGVPNTPNRKGLFNLIRSLDQRRNEIVHWHTVSYLNADEYNGPPSPVQLTPPTAWAFKSDQPKLGTADLIEFCQLATFVHSAISIFTIVSNGTLPRDADAWQTWHEILQQPCTYPPSKGHPLFQTPEELQSQPQPSRP